MKTIWKLTLTGDVTRFSVPVGATVLTAHEQHGRPCLWVLVDTMMPTEERTFRMLGTGHTVPDEPLAYVGTVYLMDGDLVFHVFERGQA